MRETKAQYEEYKKNHPEERLPEWGTLAHRLISLPFALYDEHDRLISRFVEITTIVNFLNAHRGFSFLTEEESNALEGIYEIFVKAENEIADKLAYGR